MIPQKNNDFVFLYFASVKYMCRVGIFSKNTYICMVNLKRAKYEIPASFIICFELAAL